MTGAPTWAGNVRDPSPRGGRRRQHPPHDRLGVRHRRAPHPYRGGRGRRGRDADSGAVTRTTETPRSRRLVAEPVTWTITGADEVASTLERAGRSLGDMTPGAPRGGGHHRQRLAGHGAPAHGRAGLGDPARLEQRGRGHHERPAVLRPHPLRLGRAQHHRAALRRRGGRRLRARVAGRLRARRAAGLRRGEGGVVSFYRQRWRLDLDGFDEPLEVIDLGPRLAEHRDPRRRRAAADADGDAAQDRSQCAHAHRGRGHPARLPEVSRHRRSTPTRSPTTPARRPSSDLDPTQSALSGG